MAKETEEEQHICALQLDVIERCLTLWSNPGDILLTPFMGIGSEVYGAVMNGRKALGVELKGTYYRQSVVNMSTVNDVAHETGSLPFGDDSGDDDDGDEGIFDETDNDSFDADRVFRDEEL